MWGGFHGGVWVMGVTGSVVSKGCILSKDVCVCVVDVVWRSEGSVSA